MGSIVNGLGIGFLIAIFISIYVEGLFSQVFPLWLIYGIFAPFFSALAIMIFSLQGKNRDKEFQWYSKEK